MDPIYDVAIIGGGINGCGCAADAAIRGLSVILCEQDDIASKTSSSSTKLIHGGLRYLEFFDFKLVKKALDERELLMQSAPNLVHPLPLILPHTKNTRPFWLLRAGLFLYDHLSHKNSLPHTKIVRQKKNPLYFLPLNNRLSKGFLYYDCAADDARLTLINALQAKEHGAHIKTRTKLIQAEYLNQQWRLTLKPSIGDPYIIRCKSLINAAGPWVSNIANMLNTPLKRTITLIKGSHIIIHKLYEGEHAYFLQHQDKRIIFVIPYHGYTMIGTTDVAIQEPIEDLSISNDEIDYLLSIVNHYFKKKLEKENITYSWSGVRPLLADDNKNPKALSRDYECKYTANPGPAITIYGGKITTYRQLASEVVDQLQTVFPDLKPTDTMNKPLPGAYFETMSFKAYQQFAKETHHWLPNDVLDRYLATYGTLSQHILKGCSTISDLGICFAKTVYQVEIDYLLEYEWAHNLEDILWRRTKLGLNLNAAEKAALQDYLLSQKTCKIGQ